MAPPAPPPPDEADMNGENQSGSTTMTNGPSAPQGEAGNQLWERAWTVEEMRKGAGNWSLAGDAGLLLMLQEFSQRMISKTHEIEKSVEGLVHQAKISGVKLDNVFNDFIMLANTQFVENRVYDEDVSQDTATDPEKKTDEQEKSREQREAELIPKISEALNFGIKVIEDSFETLDVNAANSDSEDEDIPQRADPILEPKDPYVIRPLPHIIGSALFMQEDDVGLVEPLSDVESESHGSISESEAEEEADQSEESSEGEYSESESGSEDEPKKRPEPRRTIHSTSSESGSEGDLFGGKDSDAENNIDSADDTSKQKKQHVDFTSELASKIGVPPKHPNTKESDDDKLSEEEAEQKEKVKKERSESSAGKSKKKHHEHKHRDRSKSKIKSAEKVASHAEDDDPFGAPTRVDEEDDSPFGKKGLFSGSRGLFDEEEEEGGLFDDIEKPKSKAPEKAEIVTEDVEEPQKQESRPRTRSGKKVPAGGISIFGGGDDDLFTESTREAAPEERKSAQVQSKPVSSGGLFDDDAEDDLFATAPTKTAQKSEKPKTSAIKPVDSLFGEEEEDDLFGDRTASNVSETAEESKAKPKKKLPAGAVSMFGNAPNPLAAALKQKLGVENSDEEDDKGSSDEVKSRSGSVKSSNSVVSSSGSLNKAVSAVKKGDKPSPSGSSNSLFADEPEDDLFSTKPPPVKSTSKSSQKKSTLFADEEDTEGDLFGGAKDTPKPTTKEEKSDGLFGGNDAPEDDLFGAASSKPRADSGRKKPVGGVALFGGADLFGKKPSQAADESKAAPTTIADKHEVTKPVPRKNTLSLFDDEDDLFGGGKVAAPPKPEVKSRSKSKSLFADEDVLFGGPSEDVPSVDIFGESPQVTPEKTAPKPKKPEKSPEPPGGSVRVKGATTLSSSTDLFGGIEDEEVDLFGGKLKEDVKPKATPKVEEGKVILDDATTTETSDEPPEKPVEPRKPKKPAGAVSMFGGIDPFAALKKKQPAEPQLVKDPLFDDSEEGSLFSKPVKKETTESVSEPTVAPKPVVSKPKKPVGGVSMFGGFDPLGGNKSRTESQEKTSTEGDLSSGPTDKDDHEKSLSTSPPSPSKGIGKLKANLMINPAALLPGAAPPVKEAEPVSVGFDQPAEASTLHSASKDRAKIITRRRPQSRKARKQAASANEAETEDLLTSPTTPPVPSPTISAPPKFSENSVKSSSDLFGNDDILGVGVNTSSRTDSILSVGQEKYEDDIFSKEFTKTSVKQSTVTIKEEVEDDLFTASTVSASKKVTTTTTTTSKVPSSIITETEQDDLFAGLETKNGATATSAITEKQTNSEQKSKIVAPVPDIEPAKEENQVSKTKAKLPDDDDIFSDSSILKKEPTPPPVEDDIFSDSILNKPPPKAADTFDDDDIFAASAPKKDKKKKQVTKDEDLFKDETDIFADLPASKPKEKKKKKTSSTSKKSVFKDDVDDIFADSSLQAKPKKDSGDKKKKSASKRKEVDDIFEDPLNAAGP